MYHAVALFSGGLDSILAVKTLEAQGLSVKCLHFVSPFFGKPERLDHWHRVYGFDIEAVDIGENFIALLHTRPVYGFGKTLNPCVDCKILMLRHAKLYMQKYGARCVVSGEVMGQRPMSQRRDTLDCIRRDSGLGDALLRPLCAALQRPTDVEREGLVDRNRLHALYGRSRAGQLALARDFGLTEIPAPAGGCRLTEKENTRRYWPVLTHVPQARVADFDLANLGRQLWARNATGVYWLCVGRDATDNALLERWAKQHTAHSGNSADIFRFVLRDMPGPLGLARPIHLWTRTEFESAAAVVASYAPHAVRQGGPVCMDIWQGSTLIHTLHIMPQRIPPLPFTEPSWEDAREALHAERRQPKECPCHTSISR